MAREKFTMTIETTEYGYKFNELPADLIDNLGDKATDWDLNRFHLEATSFMKLYGIKKLEITAYTDQPVNLTANSPQPTA